MDLDWKIKQLEENLRHEQERKLQGDRLDTHDEHFAQLHLTLDRIGQRLDEITEIQKQHSIDQAKTEMMLQNLIQAIAREHTNGKSAS